MVTSNMILLRHAMPAEHSRCLSANNYCTEQYGTLTLRPYTKKKKRIAHGCDLCHIACWDGAHQCIHLDRATGPVDGHVELHRDACGEGNGEQGGNCRDAGFAQGARGVARRGRFRRRWSVFRA